MTGYHGSVEGQAPYLRPVLPPHDEQVRIAAAIAEAVVTLASLQAAGIPARQAHRLIIGLPVVEPVWRCAYPGCPDPDDPEVSTHTVRGRAIGSWRHPWIGRPVADPDRPWIGR